MHRPPRVFISYSHADAPWKDRLVKHLDVVAYEGGIAVWDDRQIAAGDDWELRMEEALDQASVAVLLVSADFLTSSFIRGHEIPRLLQRRKEAGVRVIPILVKPCAWKEVRWLAPIQIRPGGDLSLSGMSEHDADDALANLASEIAALQKSSTPDPPARSDPPSEGSTRDALVLALAATTPTVNAANAPQRRNARSARRAAWLGTVAAACAIATYAAWRLSSASSGPPDPAAPAGVARTAGQGAIEAPAAFATIEFSLALRRDASADCNAGPAVQFVDSSLVFRAGDCLSIRLFPRREGVLYVVNEGPQHAQGLPQFNVVFPAPGLGATAAYSATPRDVVLPWLRFDSERGTELLWIVFSARPIAAIETAAVRRSAAGEILDKAARRTLRRFLDAAEPARETRDGVRVTLASTRDPLVHVLRLDHR